MERISAVSIACREFDDEIVFFEDIGHSKYARRILKRYLIGTLKRCDLNDAEWKSFLENREQAAQYRADEEEKRYQCSSKLESTKFKVDVDLHDKNVKKYTYYNLLANEAAKRIQAGLECMYGNRFKADSSSIENPTNCNNETMVNIKVIKCNPGIDEGSTCCGECRKDVVEFDIAWGVSNTNDDKVVASGKKSYTAPSIVYGCLGPIYYGEKLIFNVAEFDIPWDIHTFLSDYFLSELN